MTNLSGLRPVVGLSGLALLLLTTACVTTPPDNNAPYEGNVLPESYKLVSGVKQRRSAHAEEAMGIAGATGAAVGHVAAGGTPQNFSVSDALPTPSSNDSADMNRKTSCFADGGAKP